MTPSDQGRKGHLAQPPNGLELCRAVWRALLLFYDLWDGWQVCVPHAAEAASAPVSGWAALGQERMVPNDEAGLGVKVTPLGVAHPVSQDVNSESAEHCAGI